MWDICNNLSVIALLKCVNTKAKWQDRSSEYLLTIRTEALAPPKRYSGQPYKSYTKVYTRLFGSHIPAAVYYLYCHVILSLPIWHECMLKHLTKIYPDSM